jgi:hypothetical protein
MQNSWESNVTNEQLLSFDRLSAHVEQQQKKAQFRTLALSFATIGIAGLFLLYTFRQIESAQQQLNAVNSQIAGANAQREQAQASLKTAQEGLQAAQVRAAALARQVESLQGQLAESQKALADSQRELAETKQELAKAEKELAEALDLEQYIYHLNWGDLKSMYMEFGAPAMRILEVIDQLKDKVHWDRANDPSQAAYNSPGFAALVLQRLNRLPTNGNLAALARDTGTPNVGDIVVYEGGYHLFYFRDRSNTEFVVGMTPYGVTALNYDFGGKITGVLRTGLLTR